MRRIGAGLGAALVLAAGCAPAPRSVAPPAPAAKTSDAQLGLCERKVTQRAPNGGILAMAHRCKNVAGFWEDVTQREFDMRQRRAVAAQSPKPSAENRKIQLALNVLGCDAGGSGVLTTGKSVAAIKCFHRKFDLPIKAVLTPQQRVALASAPSSVNSGPIIAHLEPLLGAVHESNAPNRRYGPGEGRDKSCAFDGARYVEGYRQAREDQEISYLLGDLGCRKHLGADVLLSRGAKECLNRQFGLPPAPELSPTLRAAILSYPYCGAKDRKELLIGHIEAETGLNHPQSFRTDRPDAVVRRIPLEEFDLVFEEGCFTIEATHFDPAVRGGWTSMHQRNVKQRVCGLRVAEISEDSIHYRTYGSKGRGAAAIDRRFRGLVPGDIVTAVAAATLAQERTQSASFEAGLRIRLEKAHLGAFGDYGFYFFDGIEGFLAAIDSKTPEHYRLGGCRFWRGWAIEEEYSGAYPELFEHGDASRAIEPEYRCALSRWTLNNAARLLAE